MQNVNYPGLRTLYDKYHEQGFNLLAFPCNQFGGQAPGTSEEERQWAFKKFGFEFPVYVSHSGRGL
jgi:glutathione peroxidase